MSGGQTMHSFDHSQRRRNGASQQKARKRRAIANLRHAPTCHKGLHLGREHQPSLSTAVIKWLDSQAVSSENQATRPIVQSKGEHPAQLLEQALDAPFLVSVN